jgi:hypothetical protein
LDVSGGTNGTEMQLSRWVLTQASVTTQQWRPLHHEADEPRAWSFFRNSTAVRRGPTPAKTLRRANHVPQIRPRADFFSALLEIAADDGNFSHACPLLQLWFDTTSLAHRGAVRGERHPPHLQQQKPEATSALRSSSRPSAPFGDETARPTSLQLFTLSVRCQSIARTVNGTDQGCCGFGG